MATTTNYSWTTPDDTALVKDGAAAIRSLGTAIDTTVFNNASAGIAKTIVDAKGDIIAATAADTVSRLAVGANDTVLTADSTAATGLKWATASAGGYTQLATGSLSGASITMSSISSAYRDLVLIVENYQPSSDTAYMLGRFNGDSGSSYYQNLTYSNNASTGGVTTWSANSFQITGDSDNGTSNSIIIFNMPAYTRATWKVFNSSSITNDATTTTSMRGWFYCNYYNQTAAISQIQLFPSSGSFTSGTYYLYGVK